MNNNFTGVVIGGDVNSYGIARAFYEKYQIKTIIIAQKPLFPIISSKIVECYYYDNLLEDDVLIKALNDIEKKYPNTKKILFGNIDYYVRHIIKNKKDIEKISKNYIIPMTSLKQFDELVNKESFYKLCEKYDLDYPRTESFNFKKDDIKKLKGKYDYPIFIKPSDSVVYSKYDFEGKQKGYKIENEKMLLDTLEKVKKSGFDGKFLIQEYIEGDDDSMYVFTCYADKNSKVKAITAGKIIMHDRTPELIGNYNAITNFYNKELGIKLKNFLEKIKFKGICHFDVQYSKKKNKYIIYEMNIRQGRSNYYTLASKINLPYLLVEDYILNHQLDFVIANNDFTVSMVSKKDLKKAINKKDIHNFYRFTLASYDFNLKRLYYQYHWDKKILNNYYKYKEEK